MDMSPEEAERLVRSWLASERIEIREQDDPCANAFAGQIPSRKNGHMFAVVIPKGETCWQFHQ